MCRIVKGYKDNKKLRDSFNELAEKTFHLSFETWYQNGFWEEDYIPYSVVINDRVVANVSVNRCCMEWDGRQVNLLQLGTVMTDREYRGKGYSRSLINEIEKDFADQAEGIYLFANDSVLGFYPKFGFRPVKEYQYSKVVETKTSAKYIPFSMKTREDWAKMVEIIQTYPQCGRLNLVENTGLFLFYLSSFMRENVYYLPEIDTYAVAELEKHALLLHAVFSKAEVKLDRIIDSFGADIHKVIFGFTPWKTDGYEIREVQVDGTTLFVKGNVFCDWEEQKIMFSTLSHA